MPIPDPAPLRRKVRHRQVAEPLHKSNQECKESLLPFQPVFGVSPQFGFSLSDAPSLSSWKSQILPSSTVKDPRSSGLTCMTKSPIDHLAWPCRATSNPSLMLDVEIIQVQMELGCHMQPHERTRARYHETSTRQVKAGF